MRTNLVLTLSLLTGIGALTAPAQAGARAESLAPMVLREEACFGSPQLDDGVQLNIQTRGMGSGRSGFGSGGGSFGSSGASSPPPSAPQPARAPSRRDKAQESVAAAPAGEATRESKAMEPMPEAEEDQAPIGGMLDAPQTRHRGPRIDWGGQVWLSNDDSMSLASAQRLLYALDRGVSFTLDQIRPHELLNYFTFDTTKPKGTATFQVDASAEVVDGDTLALALAVQAATPARDDLDLTLVVDRSGSMNAEGRMSYTQRALRHISDNLRHGDQVDVVLFDSTVCTPLENFVVGRDDPAILRRVIERTAPRGSTDLNSGLTEGYRIAKRHAELQGREQRVMLFTDAILNTGQVDPDVVSEVGRALDHHDIRLTGVGVGRGFRDDVLDKLTDKGKGAYVFLGSEKVVDRLFDHGFDALVQTVAHDVRYRIDLPDSLGMQRFYGEESSTRMEDVQPVHVHAGNSQVFLQDLAIRDGRLMRGDTITLDISWDDPRSGRRTTQTVTTTVGAALQADPHNVRKARALMAWTDILTAHAMGGQACDGPFMDYRQALPGLQDDAEIAYVSELIGKWCGEPSPVAAWTRPAFLKVRLDADQPISDVELTCGSTRATYSLTASDQVARFDRLNPGSCQLTLHGAVPMTQVVTVPETGTDLRCMVRGGRMTCT